MTHRQVSILFINGPPNTGVHNLRPSIKILCGRAHVI